MSKIEQMFDFQGKTTKLIGSGRAQAYREIYNHLSENKIQMNYQFMKIILAIMN